MREYNFWTTIAFGLFYTIAICLGAIDTITCVNVNGAVCAGTDRIITTPELLILFALPLIVLAFIHTIWYGKSNHSR